MPVATATTTTIATTKKAKPKQRAAKAKATTPKQRRRTRTPQRGQVILEYLLPPGSITEDDVLAGVTDAEARLLLEQLPTFLHWWCIQINAARYGAEIRADEVVRHLRPRGKRDARARLVVWAALDANKDISLSRLAENTGYSRSYVCRLRRDWREARGVSE